MFRTRADVKEQLRDGRASQWVEHLLCKRDDLSSIPRMHVEEGENKDVL